QPAHARRAGTAERPAPAGVRRRVVADSISDTAHQSGPGSNHGCEPASARYACRLCAPAEFSVPKERLEASRLARTRRMPNAAAMGGNNTHRVAGSGTVDASVGVRTVAISTVCQSPVELLKA